MARERTRATISLGAVIFCATSSITGNAQPGTEDFVECAVITVDANRLACYDRLATELIEIGFSQERDSSLSARASGPAVAPEATSDIPGSSPAEPEPIQQPPPSSIDNSTNSLGSEQEMEPSSKSEGERRFGAERGLQSEQDDLEQLHSRIVGEFTGWEGDTVFRLENGQVWQQARSGRLVWRANGPAVTIKRGFMGGYRLSVEGVNKEVYVRRIK